MILCRIVMAFGLLNVLLLFIATLIPLPFNGLEYGWPQTSSLMILQGFVAVAMIYAASEKIRGSDIGRKAFPASIMSYVLWLCMFLRWVAQ